MIRTVTLVFESETYSDISWIEEEVLHAAWTTVDLCPGATLKVDVESEF